MWHNRFSHDSCFFCKSSTLSGQRSKSYVQPKKSNGPPAGRGSATNPGRRDRQDDKCPGGIGTPGIDWAINNAVHSHVPLFKHLLSDFIKGQLNVLISVIFLFFFQLPFEANYCLKNSIMMTSADQLQNRIVNCKAHY